MSKFQEIYLMSYFIGEGLSGFVPSIVALIQGVGGNPECRNVTGENGPEIQAHTPDPRFSVEFFFYFLFLCTLISLGAFVLLNKKRIVKPALITSKKQKDDLDVTLTNSRVC
jgi:riboflavin transporter 2